MAFDTERAARRLADAGMDERAANGVADVVHNATDGLATEASLQSGLHALEAGLLDVKADIARLEGRIEATTAKLEARMIKWTVGAVLGGMSASAAIAAAIAQLIGG